MFISVCLYLSACHFSFSSTHLFPFCPTRVLSVCALRRCCLHRHGGGDNDKNHHLDHRLDHHHDHSHHDDHDHHHQFDHHTATTTTPIATTITHCHHRNPAAIIMTTTTIDIATTDITATDITATNITTACSQEHHLSFFFIGRTQTWPGLLLFSSACASQCCI